MEQERQLIFVGDIHGEWDKFFITLDRHSLNNCDIICVGDIDINFAHRPELIYKLNDSFKELNIVFLGIRGNHDFPDIFDGSVDLPNFKLIPDYSVKEFNGQKFLFIGGSISIDRQLRTEGEDYWRGEVIRESELPKEKIDVIVTHDCPNFVGLSCATLWDEIGNPVKTDAFNGRRILDKVWEQTKPDKWFYGHYHLSMNHVVDNTHFKCLNILELVEYKH